jgi:hypothetical protein
MSVRAGAAVALLACLLPGIGAAAPFRIAPAGDDGAWVLDEATGAVAACRMTAGVGPKIVDVFGAGAEVRPETALPASPECTAMLRGSPSDADVPDFAAGGYGGMAPEGYGDGYRGPGSYPGALAGGAGYGGGLFSVAVRPGMLGDGSSGYQIGSGVGMLGDGTFGYGYGAPDNQVIIVRPEWINVSLD